MSDTFERIINLARDHILLVRPDHTLELANERVASLTGIERTQLEGRRLGDILDDHDTEHDIAGRIDRCFEGEEVQWTRPVAGHRGRGLFDVHMTPFRDGSGDITHTLVFMRDLLHDEESSRRYAEAQYRDPLTGLLTRRSLELVLEKEIANARRSTDDDVRALLFISLKNFKRINQTHGTRIGDLLLENTGLRITAQLRQSDYVFRFEGSNLVVLLPRVNRNTDPAIVAQKLVDAVGVPYRYRGMDLRVWAIIGVAVFPDDALDGEILLQRANSAAIEAEAADRSFQLYDTSLHERAVARMTLHTELMRAFESRQLELYYQPIVDAEGVIHGAEALVRWHHPTRGLITPKHFLRLAEDTGIVRAIDKWVLFSVCTKVARWSEEYRIFVSMNISPKELDDEELTEVIRGAMNSTGERPVPPGRLKLELTESGCMADPQNAVRRIRQLNELGADTWIDDFGTGQSSLSYLKRLPVPVLKIDKTFVDDLDHSREDREYLGSIIAGVRSRGKQVIIEGVSTATQRDILVDMGVRWMQGYYFCKPLSAEAFAGLLSAGVGVPVEHV
ncbi:MAG: putative bifunctional diguanylate cyclase/phosphodiesterase [Spirochaetaceae bacterium]